MALEKASLMVKKTQEKLEFTYNPSDLSIAKTASWTPTKAKGVDVPMLEYGGSASRSLTMQLLFDDLASPRRKSTVTQAVTTLLKWMHPEGPKVPPPILQLVWGSNKPAFYECVLTNLTAKYTLFSPDGTPVRATFNVTLLEVPPGNKKQNPTSGGPAGRSTRVVRAGDSLQSISNEEYGTPTAWRDLARANGIDDPLRLRPGQTILVPPPPA